jgi:uncharacterized protein YjbI with pentapeptide repeats
MAEPEEQLKQGPEVWNAWRQNHPNIIRPDLTKAWLEKESLSGADLSGADLSGATLTEADLSEAQLTGANFTRALLSGAHLIGAHLNGAHLVGAHLNGAHLNGASLYGAYLRGADFTKAHLTGADLRGADLSDANLFRADLRGANLERALLIETKLGNTNLTGCRIYGISAWGLKLTKKTKQIDLVITKHNEPRLTADNLEVAQFLYLLLHNEKIRDVIDTIGKKAVLILGRFTPERKAVLDALRDELRRRGYLPIVFDFEKPAGQDLLGTVETLARLARFVIADITEASSVPAELQAVVPHLRTVPVRPLLRAGSPEYALFAPLKSYPWVLEAIEYRDVADVRASLDQIIAPAEAKACELRPVT